MYVLGIWDGHDAGSALLEDNKILFASNEERYTKRKLEIKFPHNSIVAALSHSGLKPKDVEVVAFPTVEFAKTISRIFPYQQEVYYRFRRRKMLRPRAEALMHYLKYMQTGIGVLPSFAAISKFAVRRHLSSMGFEGFQLYPVDHHTSHAATAAFASGFDKALVITLDGLGDGLSGSLNTFVKGSLERTQAISARNSIGIFFEQVTNIVGMRELEDEGKVMAMACYSYPFPFEENKLRGFFKVVGTEIFARYSPVTQYGLLSRIAWSMPREQFSYMAQQLLEQVMTQFVSNSIDEYGMENVAMAGGIFSNVKANMQVRNLPALKKWFIFPHMGDGGTAMGAAMYANHVLNGISHYKFDDVYFGDGFSDEQVKEALQKERNLRVERDSDKSAHAAELISRDNYVFWFQGRMEFGPRALGNRSILAKSGSESVKEKLNLYVKQREWYQPFAPAMLVEEARRLLDEVKGVDKFMTMAYRVRDQRHDVMRSVMHVDNTARPQMVGDESRSYRRVLQRLKRLEGYGVMLNTSFNIHGMPIVMSPEDAINTMKKTRTKHMFIGSYYVENRGA